MGCIGEHEVCWRYYGEKSPNKGKVSVILNYQGAWVNLGVWERGPIPVSEIQSRIAAVTK